MKWIWLVALASVTYLIHHVGKEDLYEEARRMRVRRLSQLGDEL